MGPNLFRINCVMSDSTGTEMANSHGRLQSELLDIRPGRRAVTEEVRQPSDYLPDCGCAQVATVGQEGEDQCAGVRQAVCGHDERAVHSIDEAKPISARANTRKGLLGAIHAAQAKSIKPMAIANCDPMQKGLYPHLFTGQPK